MARGVRTARHVAGDVPAARGRAAGRGAAQRRGPAAHPLQSEYHASIEHRRAYDVSTPQRARHRNRMPVSAQPIAPRPGRAQCSMAPGATVAHSAPEYSQSTVLCESTRSPSLRCRRKNARCVWRGGGAMAVGSERGTRASTHVPLVSVSAAACQAAPLSTAADRRSGGSPGSQVVDRDSVLYHSIRSGQPNPPAERAATLCTPRPRSAAVDGEYRDAAEDPSRKATAVPVSMEA